MGKPPKTYPESVADQLGSKLDYLAQNPKGLQVKELVSRMKSRIEAAQASGYTLDDIANVFKAEGFSHLMFSPLLAHPSCPLERLRLTFRRILQWSDSV